jgi:hypothetical protein
LTQGKVIEQFFRLWWCWKLVEVAAAGLDWWYWRQQAWEMGSGGDVNALVDLHARHMWVVVVLGVEQDGYTGRVTQTDTEPVRKSMCCLCMQPITTAAL